MPEIICIVCPKGCQMNIESAGINLRITGNGCNRGASYAREEAVAPKRIITGVVTVIGTAKLLPVKTAAPVPKNDIFKVMAEIRTIRVIPPVQIGQIVKENIAGTGVDLMATKNIGIIS